MTVGRDRLMFDVVDRVLELAAARGARDVEADAERGVSRRIKVYQGEVEQLVAARRRGVGVRVFRDGAVGYASTSDLGPEGLDDVVARAVAYAAAADGDPFRTLPVPSGPAGRRRAVRPPLAAGRPTCGHRPRSVRGGGGARRRPSAFKTVEDTVYVDGDGEVYATPARGCGAATAPAQCYASRLRPRRGRRGMGETALYAVGRALEDLDGRPAAPRRRACVPPARRAPFPSMKAAVVLDPVRRGSVSSACCVGAHGRGGAEGPLAVRRP